MAVSSQVIRRDPVADLNRQALRRSGVFTVCVTGGPARGKTTLINRSVERLAPFVRVGVIVLCDVASQADALVFRSRRVQVAPAGTGPNGVLEADSVRDALVRLELPSLDLLFIENVGTLIGPPIDLGQDAVVPLFSVAGGDGIARLHPELVRSGAMVILNKIDLLSFVPFELRTFRADVQALNPSAELIELSGLSGEGFGPWLSWLVDSVDAGDTRRRLHVDPADAGQTSGDGCEERGQS